MIQRIATTTVIRGNGECQAFVNGVINIELKRQQEQMQAEIRCQRERMQAETERARIVEDSRGRLLARRLSELEGKMEPQVGPLRRLRHRAGDAWAIFWAMIFCWSEALREKRERRL